MGYIKGHFPVFSYPIFHYFFSCLSLTPLFSYYDDQCMDGWMVGQTPRMGMDGMDQPDFLSTLSTLLRYSCNISDKRFAKAAEALI